MSRPASKSQLHKMFFSANNDLDVLLSELNDYKEALDNLAGMVEADAAQERVTEGQDSVSVMFADLASTNKQYTALFQKHLNSIQVGLGQPPF